MTIDAISQVRRFNRIVTERVGALDQRFLARDRPLGAARVLWEIGDEGVEIRALRERLELDSGYLSRLLRTLEADGLVVVGAKQSDRRVRFARLTPAGSAERRLLDRRSDQLAAGLLTSLSDAQQSRLVAAMAEVDQLLTASMVEVVGIDPADPRARQCVEAYFTELDRRFDGGFDPGRSLSADHQELRPPQGWFLVATLRTAPIGCGAVKFHREGPAEVKRMWVAETARGLGIGRRILAALEAAASDHGATGIRLETNHSLAEAIGLYRSCGYSEVAAFNDEAYAHHWFEKALSRPSSAG